MTTQTMITQSGQQMIEDKKSRKSFCSLITSVYVDHTVLPVRMCSRIYSINTDFNEAVLCDILLKTVLFKRAINNMVIYPVP